MIPFQQKTAKIRLLLIAGPTASGKSSRAVEEAIARGGEVISVDSRQVYRGLDIGTEKITKEEMRTVPHHLIDIRSASEPYSAGEFVHDAKRIIADIHARGKLPILAGGSHFYFDAFLHGLPDDTPINEVLREELEKLPTEALMKQMEAKDPRRAGELDPKNRRRLVRALEILDARGLVPERIGSGTDYDIEWIIVNPEKEELAKRIDARLESAFRRGLVNEVRRVRQELGDVRLAELGLEYRIVGEYLRGEREEKSLKPALSAALRDYARRQRGWLRKLGVSAQETGG